MRYAASIAAILVVALAATAGAAQAKSAPWTALADCSAYYQANARLIDPGRPASMAAQMSAVADDYARAATARFAKRRKASARDAQHAVASRIKAGLERLGPRPPRGAVERLIDKCPQPDA